jgi:tartrate dehydratase alpha subunit/fumarate hydratase class I-like protein
VAASVSSLQLLHEALAEMFLEDIRICREEGIPMSASDKGVIVTFLKNNNITADVTDEQVQAVKEEFQNELAAKRAERAKRITQRAGQDMDGLVGVL